MTNYSQILSSMYRKAKYPNLLAEHISGWCVDALACGANVSNEVMKAVLQGGDDLTLTEAVRLSNYIWCKIDYLFSPNLEILDNKNVRHKIWINEQIEIMRKIWEEANKGNVYAIDFIHSATRTRLVNMELDFINGELVTYARYRKVKGDMEFSYHRVFRDQLEGTVRKEAFKKDSVL